MQRIGLTCKGCGVIFDCGKTAPVSDYCSRNCKIRTTPALKELYRKRAADYRAANINAVREKDLARQYIADHFKNKPITNRCTICKAAKAKSIADAKKLAWKNANIEYLRELNRENQKEKRINLYPAYIAAKLKLPLADIPADLIELKREQLTLRRMARQLRKQIHESSTDIAGIPGQPGRGDNAGRPAPDRGQQPAGPGPQGN